MHGFQKLSCLSDNWKQSKCPKVVVGFILHSCKRIKNDAIIYGNRKIPKVSSNKKKNHASKQCVQYNSSFLIDTCN